MTSESVPVDEQRPGGWVEGIGWVARLCDLDGYDTAHETEEGPQEADLVQMWTAHERIRQVVIVTRWADGTTPSPPAVPEGRPGGELAKRLTVERFAMHTGHQPHRLWFDGDAVCRLNNHFADKFAAALADAQPSHPAPDGERPLIGHMMTLAFIELFPDEPKYQQQWSGRLQGMAMSGLVWRFHGERWQATSYGRSLLPEFPADATPDQVAAIVRSTFARPAPPLSGEGRDER